MGGRLLPNTSSWGQEPRATPEGPRSHGGVPSTADTSSISPGAGCVCAQGTVAERRTADGLVASDRGTWGPISTVRGWAEGAPAWTRCRAGRSRCEGPAGPAWGCDFPINPHNWDSQVPSLGRWPEGTHTRRPPRACGAVPPASRRRPQACSASCFSTGGPRGTAPISPALPAHRALSTQDPSQETPPRLPPDPGLPDPSQETPPHMPRLLGSGDPFWETLPHVPPGLGFRIPLIPWPCPPRKPACGGQRAAWYKPYIQVLRGIPIH